MGKKKSKASNLQIFLRGKVIKIKYLKNTFLFYSSGDIVLFVMLMHKNQQCLCFI